MEDLEFKEKVLLQIFRIIDQLYLKYYKYNQSLIYGRLKGLCDCYRSCLGDDEPLLLTGCDYENEQSKCNDDDDDFDFDD